MPRAGEGRNWGLLVVLRVRGFWILAVISCELFAFHQNAATSSEVHCFLTLETASLGFQDSNFPALCTAILKCGGTHGHPKPNKTPLG